METRSVWLVRHGQASFGKSDYDNLSETGHEQAYLLGKHFAAHGVAPSLIVSGSMKRHRQTLAEIAAGAGWQLDDAPATELTHVTTPAHPRADESEAPATPPAPASSDRETDRAQHLESTQDAATHAPRKPSRGKPPHPKPDEQPDDAIIAAHAPRVVARGLDERWNELDHRALLTAYKPAYKNMLVLKADMVRTLRPRIAFEETFEKAVDRWSGGQYDHEYPESFEQFTSRTNEALDDLVDAAHEHVVVVTSAGPVCWTAAHLTAGGSLDAWKHFTLAAVNTGVTRITIDRHGPRLLTFNEFTHLEGAGLVTNR